MTQGLLRLLWFGLLTSSKCHKTLHLHLMTIFLPPYSTINTRMDKRLTSGSPQLIPVHHLDTHLQLYLGVCARFLWGGQGNTSDPTFSIPDLKPLKALLDMHCDHFSLSRHYLEAVRERASMLDRTLNRLYCARSLVQSPCAV